MPAYTILLASASPRRREILESLGHRVHVRATSIDESEREGEAPDAYLSRVVNGKLAAARALVDPPEHDAIVVADTTVVVDAQLLQKPIDDDDARRMLRAIAGRDHLVTTRFAVANARASRQQSVVTRVSVRAMEPAEIEAYVATGEGRDKAGGYAIQGRGASFVARIDGSYGAVVGLPACEVELALRAVMARG